MVLTTLLDPEKYPAHKIAELYRLRWEIETKFDHLKTTMRMDILKSKTALGIQKEIFAYCIVYNLVRLVMIQAAAIQRRQLTTISFVDALRWLASASPQQIPIAVRSVTVRPFPFEPRSRKRRPKPGYPYLLLPRHELRKKKLSQCVRQ